ncbi:MAG TPA: J domain-containing protein [Kofleriaceae bacterium]|nr:J domain-containing protein [Kofleriaceae bacterium]
MAELARGTIADRPWGRTVGTLGLRGVTGQLTLASDGKRYHIGFSYGAIVGAHSPLAADAAVRIALTGGLVSSTHAADVARRMAAAPERDEIDVIAELVRLTPEQAIRLRRRCVAQRAARTFSIDRGEFVIDEEITVPCIAGSELDIRAVIYLGARQYLSEARLASDLGKFGIWFRLRPEAFEDLPQYGFGDQERPVIDRLLQGATLGELEKCGEQRLVRSTVYALVSCNACEVEVPGRPLAVPPASVPTEVAKAASLHRKGLPVPPRRATRDLIDPSDDAGAPAADAPSRVPRRTADPVVRQASTEVPVLTRRSSSDMQPLVRPTIDTPVARVPASSSAESHSHARMDRRSSGQLPPLGTPGTQSLPRGDGKRLEPPAIRDRAPSEPPPLARGRHGSSTPIPQRKKTESAQAADVRALIAQRMQLLKTGADHYAMLGVAQDAKPEDIRKAYFALARQLHPDRLAALSIADDNRDAQRLFAQVNTAFAVLSDAKRREHYTDILKRGGEAAVRAEQQKAEQLAQKIVEAEDAYLRGEQAMRRNDLPAAIAEFARAVELNPEEPDYHALHAWSQFCAAPDKSLVATATRGALTKAMNRSVRAVTPRFLLGRVERMLGRDADALRLFKEVLRLEPQHVEAATEARLLESRLRR